MDRGYLVVALSSNTGSDYSISSGEDYDRNYQTISKLHAFTTQLVNKKRAGESLIDDQIIKDVEEKLLHELVVTADEAVEARLREKLLHRARTSMSRKQQKREADIDEKAQELLDAITADDEDDDGETAIERMLHNFNVRQPTRNASQPTEIDWRGECVSNILRDAQQKLREKLRDQKEDLITKFEAETQEKIDNINAERAHADAEKEAVIRDLTEQLDAKSQALKISCTKIEQEMGFRKTLEDALEVLHHTEQQRRKELVTVKAEFERQATQLRDVLEVHSRCPSVGNQVSIG
ncbi:Protein of unknown function [Pyronema omphalodes CBS 100304]|uniref:Uncharacterized protein n=1 Tax=Pyronema omphalodes (strain CBS 100304) TaxID=1076935 RepID=U4KUY6_PYROM|nr:Protein of unknown function [Pyronema omphalodes CBS 100304]